MSDQTAELDLQIVNGMVDAMVAFWEGINQFMVDTFWPYTSPSDLFARDIEKVFEQIHDEAPNSARAAVILSAAAVGDIASAPYTECRYCGRKHPAGSLGLCESCGGVL